MSSWSIELEDANDADELPAKRYRSAMGVGVVALTGRSGVNLCVSKEGWLSVVGDLDEKSKSIPKPKGSMAESTMGGRVGGVEVDGVGLGKPSELALNGIGFDIMGRPDEAKLGLDRFEKRRCRDGRFSLDILPLGLEGDICPLDKGRDELNERLFAERGLPGRDMLGKWIGGPMGPLIAGLRGFSRTGESMIGSIIIGALGAECFVNGSSCSAGREMDGPFDVDGVRRDSADDDGGDEASFGCSSSGDAKGLETGNSVDEMSVPRATPDVAGRVIDIDELAFRGPIGLGTLKPRPTMRDEGEVGEAASSGDD